MSFSFVPSGSVTTPRGFLAAGVTAGLKKSGAPDLALLVSETPAVAAGAFTANAFCAAPVQYDRAVIAVGKPVRAVIINSGNANACTGAAGLRDTKATAVFVARRLGVKPSEVLVSSTGRIGVPMPMDVILAGAGAAVKALVPNGGQKAAQAIMTTDTKPKAVAVQVKLPGGKVVHIGGMAKGAGMIAPRLLATPRQHATMLSYVTTDAAVTPRFLDQCLAAALDQSFNRITVDGDMSTNDTLIVLANGSAGNTPIRAGTPAAAAFAEGFVAVVGRLARELVLDGEGVTRFVELNVRGARNREEAQRCAKAIANSALCKTAWFGADPNWGRILCAAGYSGVKINTAKVSLDYEGVPIVRGGMSAGTPEPKQVKAIKRREFRIDLDLGAGKGEYTVWTCDLTYEYVKINADYHT
ncbi:MAG: bifunctional ornithine acetyltransferase/N-acetylglutamate synthase [Lentisphaerae bacterium RIFOXYB12_FULL_65_16]|nr:MAG: bifunctional ornithine acetyltransferase/N-acetylglutamate synthase [Lentisphaerae bacterium RIFOXYA12_64_32]OGV94345.1 MAG: bifunctional ornithine acetyltransferase/N-acetylglutamate synthase [Lentisphaerae bacterium RIFOXYB12_FULL_65_16]